MYIYITNIKICFNLPSGHVRIQSSCTVNVFVAKIQNPPVS